MYLNDLDIMYIMITIILDNRETSLISLLKERDLDIYKDQITFDVQQLELGDIHIISDTKTFIFERKTVSDLLASIKDGRYREQKSRLLSSMMDCTYIIEGDDIVSTRHERYQYILSGAYLHTMYRDYMHIVFTKNINDTCTFILTLCAKIIDKPSDFIDSQNRTIDYIDCVKLKTKKIDNITPNNCFIMQLSQIPGISNVIAKNIQSLYPTMRHFIKALEESENKISTLCQIDKIGKEKAIKILQYFAFNESS